MPKPYSTHAAQLAANRRKSAREAEVIGHYNGRSELVLRSFKDLRVLAHLRGDVADVG